MKIFCNLTFIALVLLASRTPGLTQYTWEALTPSDAIQTVRTFEGNPNLVVSNPVLSTGDCHGYAEMYANTALYQLDAGGYRYTVSAYSHNRFVRLDSSWNHDMPAFYGEPYNPQALAPRVMSQDAAVAIASQYMQSHYPAPTILTEIRTYPHTPEIITWSTGESFIASYEVCFDQNCGGGVKGPSYCAIEVDSILGKIISYHQSYYPVLVSTLPTLTGTQAMTAAMNALLLQPGDAGEVKWLSVIAPDALGMERLVYTVTFTGVGVDNPTNSATYIAAVDAFNGGVYRWSVLQASESPKSRSASSGIGHKKCSKRLHLDTQHQILTATIGSLKHSLSYPPISIHQIPYLYIGYLRYGVRGARLCYNGNRDIRVEGPQRNLHFDVKSCSSIINGRKIAMAAKPLLLDGRCYIPLEAARAVLPFQIIYDSKSQHISFLPARQASK